MQWFHDGKHERVPLFSNFENWFEGTAAWTGSQGCYINQPKPKPLICKPRGAHWSPFEFESLGPSIPTFGGNQNSGLVLNLERKAKDEERQKILIRHLNSHLQWIKESNNTSMDTITKYRIDIMKSFKKMYLDIEEKHRRETHELRILSDSQCTSSKNCKLFFNTSSFELSGVINATGTLGYTSDGTEVAIWAFDTIDIGTEVDIIIDGQRAMALLSKSSVFINTKIIVNPGTLGGFPGGYSTFRKKENRLLTVCTNNYFYDAQESPWECTGDHKISKDQTNTISNNVNGPGSSSFRVYYFQ
jgi:hypothetical protein